MPATVNQIYVLSAIAGDAALKSGTVILDAPLTMTRDDLGRVHIGLGLSSAPGLILSQSPGQPVQARIDTAYVLYRTEPPDGPGPCDLGSGGIAAGNGYLYIPVLNDSKDGFVWARGSQLVTTW